MIGLLDSETSISSSVLISETVKAPWAPWAAWAPSSKLILARLSMVSCTLFATVEFPCGWNDVLLDLFDALLLFEPEIFGFVSNCRDKKNGGGGIDFWVKFGSLFLVFNEFFEGGHVWYLLVSLSSVLTSFFSHIDWIDN